MSWNLSLPVLSSQQCLFRLPRPPTSGRMDEESRIRDFSPSIELNVF